MFYNNFVRLCELKGVKPSRAALDCGISKSVVSKWKQNAEKGSELTPNGPSLRSLSDYFGVSVDYLLGKEKEPPKPERSIPWHPSGEITFAESRYAPILGTIPGGLPVLAVEDIQGYASIPYRDNEDYFFLRVDGESMAGASIRTGDLVLIRRQPCAEDGQIVACRVNGDEATLKRYKRKGDTVFLLPENPDFEPRIVPVSDFESGAAEIIGVALEVRKQL